MSGARFQTNIDGVMRRYLNLEVKGVITLPVALRGTEYLSTLMIFCMNASESDRKYVLAYSDTLPGLREDLVLI